MSGGCRWCGVLGPTEIFIITRKARGSLNIYFVVIGESEFIKLNRCLGRTRSSRTLHCRRNPVLALGP